VNVPAESLLTYRLEQPLRTGFADSGFNRNGIHYHPAYSSDDLNTTSTAYREGLQAGRADLNRNLPRNARSSRWTSGQARRDYEAGYNQGYQTAVVNPDSSNRLGSVYIGPDNNISWNAPAVSRVYVQVDNNPIQLFAEGKAGTQAAPWIEPGHVYVFFLRDMRGNEIARDQLDTRRGGYRRRPPTN
jgi:hypothetical protein